MKNKSFTIDDSLKIKGVAILFMIFHHLFRLVNFSKGFDVDFFPITIGRTAQIATFFKICVPMFAFLSGYGLLASYKKMKNKDKFYISRYLKLMPVFWVVAIISYIFVQFYSNDFVNIFFKNGIYNGVPSVLLNFLGLSGLLGTENFCDNWWYIGASFVFIFLLPIIYNAAKKYGWLNVGISIVVIPRILGIPKVSTVTALPFIFSFFLGMCFNELKLFDKICNLKINKLIKFLFYLVLLLVLYLIHTHFPRDIFWELHLGIIPVVVIIFLYEYVIKLPIISYLLKKLGEHSYIMFLIHGIILQYFKKIIYSFGHMFVITLVLTLISYLLSVLITFIMKHTGYNKLFNNIEKKYFCN